MTWRDLSIQQLDALYESAQRQAQYLHKLSLRMEQTHFDSNDDLLDAAKKAQQAVDELRRIIDVKRTLKQKGLA